MTLNVLVENFERKPVFTNISLVLTIVGNLAVWPIFTFSVLKEPNDGMFDLVPLVIGGYFFFYIDLASILMTVIATLRKEAMHTRRQKVFLISILSIIAFFVLLRILI